MVTGWLSAGICLDAAGLGVWETLHGKHLLLNPKRVTLSEEMMSLTETWEMVFFSFCP